MGVRDIRRFVFPNGKDALQMMVSLDIVDAALQHEGSTFLWELYPVRAYPELRLYPEDFF